MPMHEGKKKLSRAGGYDDTLRVVRQLAHACRCRCRTQEEEEPVHQTVVTLQLLHAGCVVGRHIYILAKLLAIVINN
jgi:hypothetical protein